MNHLNQTNSNSILEEPLLEVIRNQPIHCYSASFAIEEAPNMMVLWGAELAQKRPLNPLDQPINAPDSTLLVTLTVGQLRELIRNEIQATRQEEPDRLLDAEEAAKVLSVSEEWLYRNAKKLPFRRKLGPKMLRFSHQGMLKMVGDKEALLEAQFRLDTNVNMLI